jgi:hypothetical protein
MDGFGKWPGVTALPLATYHLRHRELERLRKELRSLEVQLLIRYETL